MFSITEQVLIDITNRNIDGFKEWLLSEASRLKDDMVHSIPTPRNEVRLRVEQGMAIAADTLSQLLVNADELLKERRRAAAALEELNKAAELAMNA